MLLLSCERGQKVVIGCEGIAVAVMEVRGDRVRLGISAPSGCAVHRKEIWQQPGQPGPPPGALQRQTLSAADREAASAAAGRRPRQGACAAAPTLEVTP
jgi:carbon storage regulator